MKHSLVASLALVLLVAAIPARAQTDFPKREITLIVGFAPGGSEDLRARAVAAKLSELLGQPVIVANRGGASGAIGLALVAKAAPDGYTLGSISASPMVFAPHLQKVEYKPSDFTYLAGSANQPFCICVRQDAPWQTMQELVAFAKQNPGKPNYGHPGNGHQSHVVVAMLNIAAGTSMTGVPFKGDSDAITSLLGGHIEMASLASTFVPHARAGKLRPLALIGDNRLKLFPDIPTLRELGYNVNTKAPALLGYAGPKGLPPEVRRKLESAFAQALRSPEFAAMLEKLDNELYYRDGETFGKQVAELYDAMGTMLKQLGI